MPNTIQNRALRLEHDNTDLDRRWSDRLRFFDQTVITPLFERPSDMGLNWRLSDGLITQWAHDFEDLPEELLWSLAQGGWTVDDLAENFGSTLGVHIEEDRWQNAIEKIKRDGYSIEVYPAGDVFVCQLSLYSGPGLPNGSGMCLSFAVLEADFKIAMRISKRVKRMNELLEDDFIKHKFQQMIYI